MSLRVYSRTELDELAGSAPPAWLWHGLLPRTGIVLMSGPALVGKTRLIALLSAAMSDAFVELGCADLAGRTVEVGSGVLLLVAAEHVVSDLRDTLAAAEAGRGMGLSMTRVVREFDIDDPTQVSELAAEADRVGADVIVIDPIRRVTRADECSSEAVSELARSLKTLGDERRLIIVIHHSGHARDQPRGSTDWVAMADTVVSVKRAGDRLLLEARHHARPPMRHQLSINHSDGKMSGEGNAEPAASSVSAKPTAGPSDRKEAAPTRPSDNDTSLEARILVIVEERRGIGARELRRAMGGRGNLVTAQVKKLANAGRLVIKTGAHNSRRYFLAEQAGSSS